MLMLAGIAPGRAVEMCSDICWQPDYHGGCALTKHVCTGDNPETAPAPSYGAIAYGRTSMAWGSSYQWGSKGKAESAAMQKCAENGNDCEVVVWFMRKCGAVAAGVGTAVFWGLGDSESQASQEAKDKCVEGGTDRCTVRAAQCSK